MKRILLLAGVCLLLRILAASPFLRRWSAAHWTTLRRFPYLLGAFWITLPVLGALAAAASGYTLFHDEASLLSITAAVLHHQPMYPGPHYPADYGLLYGPVAYLAYAPPMLAGARHLSEYQGWVALALAGSLLLTYRALRPAGRVAALTAAALLGLNVCLFCDSAWAIKGDIWILFLGALAYCAALTWSPLFAALGLGFAGGLVLDVKATTLLLMLLPAVLLYGRRLKPAWLPAAAVSLALLIAVGLLWLPGVAVRPYLHLLAQASGHGSSPALLRANILAGFWMAFLPGSLVLLAYRRNRGQTLVLLQQDRIFLAVLAGAFVVAIVTGSKNGAGPWHLMGLLVPCSYVGGRFASLALEGLSATELLQPAAVPLLAGLCLLSQGALTAVRQDLRIRFHGEPEFAYAPPHALEADLDSLRRANPGEHFTMGYSDLAHYNDTFVRASLIEAGSPLFADADALNEDALIQQPTSPEVLSALAHCRPGPWLLPLQGVPFSMPSLYSRDRNLRNRTVRQQLFPAAFRSAFLANYHRTGEHGRYFAVWRCDRG